MAKSKSLPATADKGTKGTGGRKSRGKKQPRRWAQKLAGSIINTNRRINCDDNGHPFPDDRGKGALVDPLV